MWIYINIAIKREESRSFLLRVLLVLRRLIALRGGLDELLHNLIIIPVLAVVLVIGVIEVLLDLELAGESQVVGVDAAGRGGQDGVAVLLGPPVEDAGEKSGVSQLYLLIVGFYHYLLVEVVLHCVAQHQQVRVYPLEFCRSK